MFTAIREIRARRLRESVEDQRAFYAKAWTSHEIRARQLEIFNDLWNKISRNVPFYTALKRDAKAPHRFESWEEFGNVLPVVDRALIQERAAELSDQTRPEDFMRTTGGSTSEPVQLPAWRSELDFANADMWYARSWFGINPSDKLFLIWGHSHQLGKGLPGKINAVRRKMKDAMLGYRRWSAYDLSDESMRRAGKEFIRFRPAWIMAYSVALDQFARVNPDMASDFRELKLRAAIATAESFPRADSAERIENLLGCPVVMEYGAVESGAVAHQRPDGRFQIFWRHWFVEGIASLDVPGTFEIFLTNLYPRKFPLVRYRISDLITDDPNAPDFDQTFSRVIGRCNDYVELADGAKIHSEAFSHAVKECGSVTRFQVLQDGSGRLLFRYITTQHDPGLESEIRRRLAIVHPSLHNIQLEKVPALPLTIAGKSRTIMRENR